MKFNLPGSKILFGAENEGGAGSSSSSKETFENKQTAETDEVTAVLHYDPFKKGEEIPEADGKKPKSTEKAAKAKTEDGDESGESNLPPAKEGKTPPASKKPADAVVPSDEQARHWREIAEAREAELKKLKPGEKEADDGVKIPEYNFEIPDQLIEALTTDDPKVFKGGVLALVKGMAAAVHAQMVNHVNQMYQPRFEAMPATIMQIIQAHTQNKAVSEDFYGKYPELNHASLKPLVKSVGEATAKELGKTAWDEALRDETAKRVKILLAGAAGAAPNGRDNNPPPRMLPGQGARAASTPSDEMTRDIADTLFTDFR